MAEPVSRLEKAVPMHDAIEAIVKTLDIRDPYTFSHSWRVAEISEIMARKMELSSDYQEVIHIAAHLHDIGKIGVPDAILNKPDRLNPEEFEIIKTHSRKGYEIAGRIGAFKGLCPYILHHHERWDGKGYPDGLSGKAIPLGSRIIAVADTFDAITSDREYRRKRSFNEACEIIRAGLGSQFCPDCGRIFLKHPKAIQHAILQANREIDKMTLPVRENNFLDRTPLTNLI